MSPGERQAGQRVGKAFALLAAAFVFFVVGLAIMAILGLPTGAITLLLVLATLVVFALLGIGSATLTEGAFFFAGRFLPPAFNGLGTAATFLSIGGFAGLAGVWFADPAAGLALTLGWTAGLFLLAVLIAPEFRRAGAATLPDYLGRRFDSRSVRGLALVVLLFIATVGLAAALAAGAAVAGTTLGVRPGIALAAAALLTLLSGFFGGLRGLALVTGAQAIVLLIALFVPAALVTLREYDLPLPQFAYGYALNDAGDAGAGIASFAGSLLPLPRLTGFNLFALAATLAAGAASLPQVVMRSAAASGMASARRAAGWTLVVVVFVALTAASVAALVKLMLARDIVGATIDDLPGWVFGYGRQGLVRLCGADAASLEAVRSACATALGADGALRPGDVAISRDLVVLGFADIAGLPPVVAALIAVGGIAAALAAAGGLAVTAAHALGHDLYGRLVAPRAAAGRRIIVTRLLLCGVVAAGTLIALRLPAGGIFALAAFVPAIAAAAYFPVLVLGMWWRRANAAGALAGMAAGLGITAFYVIVTVVRGAPPAGFPSLGGGVSPIAAAVYGLPIGFLVVAGVSLATATPSHVRAGHAEIFRRPDPETAAAPAELPVQDPRAAE